MNRFKKEVRKKGFKLENDYPWLPYDMKSVTLEGVTANAEKVRVINWYNVGAEIITFDRSMNTSVDFD